MSRESYIPHRPIHGMTFAQLLLLTLIDTGYLSFTKRQGYTIIDDSLWDIGNSELEELIRAYLDKRDQR